MNPPFEYLLENQPFDQGAELARKTYRLHCQLNGYTAPQIATILLWHNRTIALQQLGVHPSMWDLHRLLYWKLHLESKLP